MLDVLPKPIDPDRLLETARSVVRKGLRVALDRTGREYVRRAGFEALTPREQSVMDALIQGNSNKETGLLLKISPRTVEVHRSRIMEKYGAKNAIDLVRIALDR